MEETLQPVLVPQKEEENAPLVNENGTNCEDIANEEESKPVSGVNKRKR
jgi:hypothetical protein